MRLDQKILHLGFFSLFNKYAFDVTRRPWVPVEKQHAASKLFFASCWAWWVLFCSLLGFNLRSDYIWAKLMFHVKYYWTFCCIKWSW